VRQVDRLGDKASTIALTCGVRRSIRDRRRGLVPKDPRMPTFFRLLSPMRHDIRGVTECTRLPHRHLAFKVALAFHDDDLTTHDPTKATALRSD